jgi:hypothetical protein
MSIADELITRGWTQKRIRDGQGRVCLTGAAAAAYGLTPVRGKWKGDKLETNSRLRCARRCGGSPAPGRCLGGTTNPAAPSMRCCVSRSSRTSTWTGSMSEPSSLPVLPEDEFAQALAPLYAVDGVKWDAITRHDETLRRALVVSRTREAELSAERDEYFAEMEMRAERIEADSQKLWTQKQRIEALEAALEQWEEDFHGAVDEGDGYISQLMAAEQRVAVLEGALRHREMPRPNWDTKVHCECGERFTSRCEWAFHAIRALAGLPGDDEEAQC